MRSKLERIWKEAVLIQFKAPSRHLRKGTEETTTNFPQDSVCLGRNLNPEPAEYKGRFVTSL
jgi:hypothetical protein